MSSQLPIRTIDQVDRAVDVHAGGARCSRDRRRAARPWFCILRLIELLLTPSWTAASCWEAPPISILRIVASASSIADEDLITQHQDGVVRRFLDGPGPANGAQRVGLLVGPFGAGQFLERLARPPPARPILAEWSSARDPASAAFPSRFRFSRPPFPQLHPESEGGFDRLLDVREHPLELVSDRRRQGLDGLMVSLTTASALSRRCCRRDRLAAWRDPTTSPMTAAQFCRPG